MEKILIIDDDPDAIALLQLLLKKKGFEVSAATNEQQAYEKAAEEPHLILMDVLLSGADGRDICRKLKNGPQQHIPIIMFSAHPSAQKGMSLYGADDFLPKPFQEADLMRKIEKYLQPQSSSNPA